MKTENIFDKLSVRINLLVIVLIFLPLGLTLVQIKSALDSDIKKEILNRVASNLHEQQDKARSALKFTTSHLGSTAEHVQVHLNSNPRLAEKYRQGIPGNDFFSSVLYKNLSADMYIDLAENEHYRTLRLINMSGREIVRIEREGDAVFITSPENLQDKSHRFYSQWLSTSGVMDTHIFPPSLNMEHGELSQPHTLVFRISKKVFLANGEPMGMLILNAQAGLVFGAGTEGRHTGFLAIDETGHYLRHWSTEKLYGGDLETGHNLLAEEPELKANLSRQDFRIHWDQDKAEYRVWRKVFYNEGDRNRYMVFMIRLPESQVASPWFTSIRRGAFALSMITALSLLLILLVTGRVMKPITDLTRSIRRLESGDLSVRAVVRNNTEIGRIGAAFNDMAEQVQSKTELLYLQQNVAAAVNGAGSVDEAMMMCLQKVCVYTGWEVGHVYMPDDDGILISTNLWVLKDLERYKDFKKISQETTFAAGEGLPGRVYQSDEPLWLNNVADDLNFPRAKTAREAGLVAGFAFPVLEKEKIVAVLEYFSSQKKEPDQALLATVKNIGALVGRVTERKRAEENIKTSQNRLAMAIEVTGAGIYEHGVPIGQDSYHSDQWARILGYERGELPPYDKFMPWLIGRIHPHDVDRLQDAYIAFLDGKAPGYDVEIRIKSKAGKWIYVNGISKAVERDENNRVKRLVGVMMDVTERRMADRALREGSERLAKSQELAHIGSWEWDLVSSEMFWSDEMYRIFGYKPNERKITFELFKSRIHDEDRESVASAIQNAIKDSVRHEKQYRIIRPGGEERTVHSQAEISRDISGKPIRVMGSAWDITERMEAEEKLKLAAMVFQTSMEGVVVTDADGTIQFVNPAFTEITGYREEEAIGQNPNILKSGRHDEDFYENIWESLTKKGRWEGEIWNRRKNGEAYPELLTITSIKDGDGKIAKYAGVFHDITDIKQSEQEIEYKAYHDALTGLPNRLLFIDRVNHATHRSTRDPQKMAIMFLDLDNFKTINDSLGHAVGDLLLQGVATRLVACLRETDTVSRLGGDEFTILMENINSEREASLVARKIIESVSEPFSYRGDDLIITVSVGISVYPTDGSSVEDLTKNADVAMYHAKKLGRNRYQFFTQRMNADAMRRLELETSLRKAIEKDELVAYYQPKVAVQSGRITGVEALMRWRKDGILVMPSEFIPLAEETGLITEMDEWMLGAACKFIKSVNADFWNGAEGSIPFTISTNLSARDLERPNLTGIVTRILDSHKVPYEAVELEVTESAVIKNIDSAIVTLKKFRDMGFNISIDDFGTGYSSLSYLVKFPINTLKIDREFVRNLENDSNSRFVAKAIVTMAHELDIKVVAEGVETKAQALFLRGIKCDEIQGYFFSPPLPEEKALELLMEKRMFFA